ncbi:MAG: nicotinate phosphoribosyltransferase [Gammaproteobacteria bacterium]
MIINSLLDTDLYKFTMMQVALHKFPAAMVQYGFRCRSAHADLRPYVDEIKQEIEHLCQLRMTSAELDYLRQFRFFKPDFIEFLRIFQLSSDFIEITATPDFDIVIKGPWLHTILFEVPVLAIVSEVYFRNEYPNHDFTEGKKWLQDKIALLKNADDIAGFSFSDFGTRRRFSQAWQQYVVETLLREVKPYFAGSSNVNLARQLGIKPIGTMAHEYIQACQSLGPRLLYSQQFAFEMWAQEYRGDLGIALSDTYSLDAFLNDFDLYFCKLFDGARHDSGDPIEWGERIIAHYQAHRVDSKTKTLVFSDALNFERALEIFRHFKTRANPVFGIGSNLTNDVGPKHLDIVIKMVMCNGQPVAKISDSPSKSMCPDASYLNYLKQVFKIPAEG